MAMVSVVALMVAMNASAGDTLKIFTWSEYIDPEVVLEFEERYDAKLKFTYFESDQARDEELALSAGRGFDLIMINDPQIDRYARRGWIAPIDEDIVRNMRHIEDRWRKNFEDDTSYALPYFWGTMGIAYRSDLYPDGFTTWKELLEPAESLKQKILMVNDSRELMGFALKSQGYSANSRNRKEIEEVTQILRLQKPYVLTYGYPMLDETSVMLDGTIWAAAMYSGDVLMLQEIDDRIVYSLPEEGGLIWADYLTVAQSSLNKKLAFEFLNFINEPSIAARQAEYVYYATPNAAAMELVSQEYLDNPVIFPSATDLEKSEYLEPTPPRIRKKINVVGTELFYQ
ncbi:MAG: spermidine/putrescine ABC transporter substrate-binding protein [Granulosicoccus sp.]|nr:spermidine/putrescine ABC transporter substrate-binding protein [Granulosicoccus sp.]